MMISNLIFRVTFILEIQDNIMILPLEFYAIYLIMSR